MWQQYASKMLKKDMLPNYKSSTLDSCDIKSKAGNVYYVDLDNLTNEEWTKFKEWKLFGFQEPHSSKAFLFLLFLFANVPTNQNLCVFNEKNYKH